MWELALLVALMVPGSFSGLAAVWCLDRYRRWRIQAAIHRRWREVAEGGGWRGYEVGGPIA